jgi:regulator of protease activity HflC (stomatin/prohibitin superfamily)
MTFSASTIFLGILILYVLSCIKIIYEYERGVVFRLGRLLPVRGAGITLIFWPIDKLVRIDLRIVTLDIPPQDTITRDNVSVKVNAVLYFRVIEPARAVVHVQNFLYATSQLAQTTLRSVCGQAQLDEMLAERDKVNLKLQEIIDKSTESWGVKVMHVEIKHIDLPADMQRAMARQAEAERLRRAKVINAEGEFQAAARLREAATMMAQYPATIQLRTLETLTQIGTERNTTLVLPVPMDLVDKLLRGGGS